MLGLGSIAFATPWALGALIVLPVVWWLLRVTPPAPRVIRFPAIRLLRDVTAREETPARTPLWLLILRLLIAALVIVALSQPLLNPRAGLPGTGPMILVVDNGWAAGRNWMERRRVLNDALDQAQRESREVMVLATAPTATGEKPALSSRLRAADARRLVQTLKPEPWPTDRVAAAAALRDLSVNGAAHAVWLSDGLGGEGAAALADRLRQLGTVEVLADAPDRLAHLLPPPVPEGTVLVAKVVRAQGGPEETATVRLTAGDGRPLARENAVFQRGETVAEARLDIPVELRNEATRLAVENETSAGSTVLLDERWRRRPVGLVSGRPDAENQPLLSDLHYLEQALSPFSEVRRGQTVDLIEKDLAVLILSDIGALTGTEADALQGWIEKGGVLVRFAGPRLAEHADDLVPVRLRLGDRALGGALSWSEPAHLAPFDAKSPFAGLTVPNEVAVERQVLAEPSLDIADRTWARLADGTPLVTAARRGAGWVVLVHTTASPDWSNLPLSGLFVEMLRRINGLSAGLAGGPGKAPLEPLEVLDGQGRLTPPPATAFPVPGEAFGPKVISPRHPPGFYGTEEARRALNLSSLVTDITPLRDLPAGMIRHSYAERGETDLKPGLLGIALALAVADLLIALALRGLLGRLFAPRRRRQAAAAGALLLGLLPGASPSAHAFDEQQALKASGETYLAYVETGDSEVDEISRAGLEGLSQVLNRRTAAETAGAMAVDVESDELAYFPLLYWAVSPVQGALSDNARVRLNDYLRNGGTILIDTRDHPYTGGMRGAGPGSQRLQELVDGLDIPPLVPVTPEHVLTKAFYLMQDFPGRYAGGDVWVEASDDRHHDGVSSVIVGSNDWAGAWAIGGDGHPRNAVVPGGERQRELAYRFGVNAVMYALTGNYKADQVHVPAILERLGQ